MFNRLRSVFSHLLISAQIVKKRILNRQNGKQVANLNLKWTNQDYILQNAIPVQSWSEMEYEGVQEAEHQIMRFRNIQTIISEAEVLRINGDIIEFGTGQGMVYHFLFWL